MRTRAPPNTPTVHVIMINSPGSASANDQTTDTPINSLNDNSEHPELVATF